jgi:formylmethanofuran dehydrogenase subunit E
MNSIDLSKPRKEIEKAIEAGDLPRLLKMSGTLHGHYCPGLATGVKAAVRAVNELGASSTGMEEIIAIVETNSCFSDGVQFITGCSFGNNGLIYRDFGKTALTLAKRNGEAVRVAARPDALSLERREPEAMELFQKVVSKRQGTEADQIRLQEMWQQVALRVLDIPDDELFNVSQSTIQVPAYAPIFASVNCSICGESIMEPRARIKDGKPACISCSGHEYYQLTGDGMSRIHPDRAAA